MLSEVVSFGNPPGLKYIDLSRVFCWITQNGYSTKLQLFMCWIQLGYKTHSKTGKLFFWLDSEAVGRGDVLWEIIRFRFQRLVASSQAQELPYRAKKQNSRITRNYYLPPPPTRMSFSNHEKKMVISISDLFTSFFPPAKNWVKQVAKSVVLIETWRNRSKRSSLAETKPFQLRC